MEKTPRSSGRGEPHASILYAEPGALGLLTNIMPALIVALGNIVETSSGSDGVLANLISGAHLIFIGGLIQATAGFMSFRRNDHLTGTAFFVFSVVWFYQGLTMILNESYGDFELKYSVLPSLVAYILLALILFTCSLFVNFIMPPVLIAMTLTLIFEGIGLFYKWAKYVAAGFELVIVLSATYAVVVMATKGVSQRYILPGFGNAPIDPLLIQRKVSGDNKNEKKKNTKYAEPMGLGYMGNILPSLVISFYLFGYITDFRVAFASVLCNSILQMFGIYYAYLRQDFLYAVHFSVYLVFWLCKSALYFFTVIGYTAPSHAYFGSLGFCVVVLLITIASLKQNFVTFLYNCVFLVISILSLDFIELDVLKYTFGISSAFFCFASLYISTASLLNSIAEKPVLFVGREVISQQKIMEIIERMPCCLKREQTTEETSTKEIHLSVPETLVFLFNFVSVFSLMSRTIDDGIGTLPWLLSAGILGNLLCARIFYTSGSLARSFVSMSYVLVFLSWTLLELEGIDVLHIRGAALGALILHTASFLMSTTFSKLWTLSSVTLEIHCVILVLETFDKVPQYSIIPPSAVLALISLYSTCVQITKGVLKVKILPEGEPIFQAKEDAPSVCPCPVFQSRLTSDLLVAASVLHEGHVIGIPTDTVYALAGSCSRPESVSKIYHIKGRPPEKPICICISTLQQLKVANPPFSPLLWRFMDLCYPGGITCVVKKGDWLRAMGVGDAIDFVGTKESVAIRVPDSSVLSYLVSIAGPLAITSANPSGDPDSTHHDTVIDTLGEKLAGVVCDDESNEVVASTVVNCLNIDQGEISYFRIGCTPKEIVDGHFEKAKLQGNSN
ncbi:hypothetical protein FSP39_012668 [Pinctada imbricata]|uniref:Threonylcarbamoyl-AMP synthase n=1 Tax=Pinctada imbricata TaxID=66713 RepID=A0AA88XQT7_PINIB|nr:hypothetical protein FSP39_012668 [Pinctada imbricata]